MSGAWSKGTTKAITTAPPPGAMAAPVKGRGNGPTTTSQQQNSGNSGTSHGRPKHTTGQSGGHTGGTSGGGGGGGGGRKEGRGGGGGGGGGGGRGRGRGGGGSGHGGGGSGHGGGGGGGGRHQNNSGNSHNNSSHKGGRGGAANAGSGGNSNHRITIKDVQLLEETGVGSTPAQKSVIRIHARELVRQRLQYVQPSVTFTPDPNCHWTNENRIEIIQALCSKVMELGDVSKATKPNNANNSGNNNNSNSGGGNSQKTSKHDTAPPLEECAPLAIDEETRWKSKAMERKSSLVVIADTALSGTALDANNTTTSTEPLSTEEIVSQARLILNKISWTTLDKLTVQFLDVTNLRENDVVRQAIIKLLVEKAQMEPHFADMYSQICAIIAKQVKTFKKELLAECQKEFEIDLDHQISNACQAKGTTDPDEMEYISLLIRKAYIGHMKFLGELYMRDVVKLSIMLYCLEELLKDETHEDSLECFAHLMTTTGEKLDDHAKQNDKKFDWNKVVDLRQSTKISSRIKFLLQDLLDLRERGWVKRRKEETAKTIADIHKEVATEEKEAKMAARRASQPNLRRATSQPVEVDSDGFVAIQRSPFSSKKGGAGGGTMKMPPKLPSAGAMRRAVSQPAMPLGGTNLGSGDVTQTLKRTSSIDNSSSSSSSATPAKLPSTTEAVGTGGGGGGAVDPATCAKKIQSILKEYYVSGDTDDAVLSVAELVQASDGGTASIERGAKVIEGGTFFAMEGKPTDVPKMLEVMVRCVSEGKILPASIVPGLADPLEFLGDIEIDAPLAGKHLAQIVSECLKLNALTFDFLVKDSPENFQSGGLAAKFACQVLKQRGTDPSEEDWQIVASLMSAKEKEEFDSPKALWEDKK